MLQALFSLVQHARSASSCRQERCEKHRREEIDSADSTHVINRFHQGRCCYRRNPMLEFIYPLLLMIMYGLRSRLLYRIQGLETSSAYSGTINETVIPSMIHVVAMGHEAEREVSTAV